MKRLFSFVSLLLLGSLCFALAGCAGASGSVVSGVVTKDGEPLGNAIVEFEPADKSQGIGADTVRTDASGKFEIKPDPKKKGLSAGKYAVYVSKWVRKDGSSPPPEEMEMEKQGGVLTNQVPPKFSSREGAPLLTVEIKPGKNENVKIEVKTK